MLAVKNSTNLLRARSPASEMIDGTTIPAGLPLRTLQAETKAGKIPAARRIGRRYVYLIVELKRMVESAVRPGKELT